MKYFIGLLKKLKHQLLIIKCNSLLSKKYPNSFVKLNHGIYDEKTIDKISIGKNSYGNINIYDYNDGCELKIGSFCSIAEGVSFIMGGNHHYNRISLYPFKFYLFHEIDSFSKGNIVLNDDVWIGVGAMVLSGVTIGKGAIVAAGSIVTKDVPPYSIVGGVPAKIIKMRFSNEVIKLIENINFESLSFDSYLKNRYLFENDIDIENLKESIKNL